MKSKNIQPTAIIVQPEEDMADVLEHLLTQAGFATEVFTTGSQALQRLTGSVWTASVSTMTHKALDERLYSTYCIHAQINSRVDS